MISPTGTRLNWYAGRHIFEEPATTTLARPPVVEAVILGAGNGSRLSLPNGDPKPLANVGGLTLLDRVVRAGASAGIETVVVVTGHRAERLQARAFGESPACEVRWVHNPRFDEANGLSLLAAEGLVSGPFLLLMADHLFEQSTLKTLLRASEATDADVIMAVDFKVDSIWDLEDATKVMTVESHVRAIGKSVRPFNAIDTGMFVCGEGVFPAIRAAAASGDASLSAGVAELASDGRVESVDIGSGRWIDVDTPAARAIAERMVAAGELP